MAGTTAELIVKVEAQNTEALDKVNAQVQGVEATTAKASTAMVSFAAVAAAAATAAVALGLAFTKSLGDLLEYAEGLEKANLSTGVSIEFWQKLIKTGAEVDISFDQMRGAVERLEKTIEGNGNTLRRFGIEVENFRNLKPDEALRAFAVQVMAIEDPLVRAAVAMAGTGRSGAEMVPIFAKIVSGAVDAKRVLGTDTVEALNNTKKALEGAKTAWETLKQEVTAFVALNLPLETWFRNAASGLEAISAIARQWPGMWEAMRKGAYQTGVDMADAALKARAAEEQHAAQIPKTTQAVLDLTETARKLRAGLSELVGIWEKEEKANEKAAKAHEKQQKVMVALEKEFQRMEEAARKAAMGSEAVLLKSWNEVDVAAAAHTRRMMQEEEKQLAEAESKWRRMARAAEQFYRTDSVAAAANFFKTRTELQQTADEAEAAYRRMLEAGVATFEQLRTAHAAWKQAEADLDAKSNISKIQGFQLIAESASSILRSLFGKSKAAAIAAAIIDTIAAVVKTMAAYPWPWSLVPAAAAAAAGYAQVQKIRNQEAGFRAGTPGTSFVDFGRGSLEMLHGQEAVVTRSQAESVAMMVRDAIDEASRRGRGAIHAGSGREATTHVHLHLDGREIADVVVRRNRAGLAPMRAA